MLHPSHKHLVCPVTELMVVIDLVMLLLLLLLLPVSYYSLGVDKTYGACMKNANGTRWNAHADLVLAR